MFRALINIFTIHLFSVTLCFAEPSGLLGVDVTWDGANVVTGRSATQAAPITIYDLSYPARTALGTGTSMDNNGYFAVLVSPPLIEGHEIIAEDKDGHTSLPVMVTIPDPLTDPTQ